jgi:tetratricopeptide (TPR) repeat protein
MIATRRWSSFVVVAVLSLFVLTAAKVRAQDAGGAATAAPGQKYTMAEYNAYQAAASEKTAAAQIKELDDFVAKYPNSALLNYIYPLYYRNYGQQSNFPKTIEYADKQIALSTATPTEKYDAYTVRAYAFNHTKSPDAATAKAAYEAALAGAKIVPSVPKPDGVADADFAKQKSDSILMFSGTAGNAAMAAKDYPSAVSAYKSVLASSPDDFLTNYFLGKAFSSMTPPQPLDAMWFYARAVGAKNATAEQSTQIKTYLRKLLANYQGGTVCDTLTDAELNELLQLAATSVERPATYKPYSAADLDAARKDMTIASVVTDLKAAGDKAKLTWTASCGLEFPDVPGKLLEVTPGEPVALKTAFVTSEAEFEAATTPDMSISVAGQPEAAKLEVGNSVRFTGTLESYDPSPAFMLHWDKAKVNPEDLPKDKAPPKKPVARKPAPKKP